MELSPITHKCNQWSPTKEACAEEQTAQSRYGLGQLPRDYMLARHLLHVALYDANDAVCSSPCDIALDTMHIMGGSCLMYTTPSTICRLTPILWTMNCVNCVDWSCELLLCGLRGLVL
jgi:hypothetical protein